MDKYISHSVEFATHVQFKRHRGYPRTRTDPGEPEYIEVEELAEVYFRGEFVGKIMLPEQVVNEIAEEINNNTEALKED
jgi:hypothetical protein